MINSTYLHLVNVPFDMNWLKSTDVFVKTEAKLHGWDERQEPLFFCEFQVDALQSTNIIWDRFVPFVEQLIRDFFIEQKQAKTTES